MSSVSLLADELDHPDAADESPDLSGLRILALCDYFNPESAGGSERVAAEVYRRMASWGADITVVGGIPSQAGVIYDDGYRVIAVPATDFSGVVGAQVAVSRRLLRQTLATGDALRPHLVTAQTLHFQSSAVAALYQVRRQVPLVTTVHVAGIDELSLPVRMPTAAYEATVGKFILQRSNRVIAVSEPVRQNLLGKVPESRITVIPNGVDLSRYRPGPERPPLVDSQPPVIAFVGRLIANKGPATHIEALGLLAREGVAFRSVILGDGPLRGQLEARVDGLGLRQRVEFVGAVTDVADRLRDADIFVRPSTSEGMSLAVLEAMASGLCVIASDIPANACLLKVGVTGLLSRPGSAEDLARQLRTVLTNPILRRRLAAGARRYVLRYSWDRCAQATAALMVQASRTPPWLARRPHAVSPVEFGLPQEG